MKIISLTLFLLFAAVFDASAEPELVETMKSRFGKIEIFVDKDAIECTMKVGGKVALKYSGDGLAIYELNQIGAHDVVLLVGRSGGIACPYPWFIVDLQKKVPPKVSEEFGSCLEIDKVTVKGDSIVIQSPAYVPHPELLTPRDVDRSHRTTLFFTWKDGTITESSRVVARGVKERQAE